MSTNDLVTVLTNLVEAHQQQTEPLYYAWFMWGLGWGLTVGCTALLYRIVRGASSKLDI